MEKLQITKEKILSAASKSKGAKETLETLFPEAFIDYNIREIINDKHVMVNGSFNSKNLIINNLLAIRTFGEYKNKAFVINDEDYEWEIKNDDIGCLCLIPTKI